MATDTDLVASKAAALRLAKRMGCTGAHQHPDGKWMPCSTMEEYEKLKKTQPDSEKSGIEIIESRRRYRNSKGRNKRNGWEKLGERGLTSIDTISGGGLVGGRSGSIKAAGGWAPDDEDPDVFTSPRGARRRARQLGCIGIARRTSRAGKTVWTPCSNMTDYAKRTGSTAFGRHHQRRQARRTLERAVAREVRRQLRRKKSLMETLYEGKALGRKLRAARIATTTSFDPDARDADMDMLVQEGTPWERPARPRIPQIGTNRAGRRRAERGADRRERRRDLNQPERPRSRQETARTAAREWRRMMTGQPPTADEPEGFASQRYEFNKRFPGFASERHESVEELRKEILDRVGEEHRNKDHREVHLVVGPPGVGKTSRVNDGTLHVPGKGEAAHTDPDIYKPYDPAWNDGEGADVAHQRSRHESRKTIKEAEKLGMDVVVQGTGKDGQLLSDLVFVDGDFEKGRREDVTSIMHFVWTSGSTRPVRIFDRGVGRGPDDQRRRFGTDIRDEMEIRDRITKYIEEGRLDEFYIYDNDVDADQEPPVVASFLDGVLVIHDEEKFDEIFTETDADGNPVTLSTERPISPGTYADPDDPRIGKTHAQRIRDVGEDPEAYRKYDAERRKAGRTQKNWLQEMLTTDPDAEEGHASRRSLGDEYRMAQKARGWASQRGESFEDRYGQESPQGEGDCFVASVKAGRELEEAGVDNYGNPISNVRIVHGAPLGVGGEAEGLRYTHAWVEYDVEAPEPVFHRDLLDPETQKQILERVPDDMRKEFMELIKVSLQFEQQIKDGESNLFDNAGIPRPGKRTMVRDWSNVQNDSDEYEPYVNIDREKLLADRPDFDKDWYYNKGTITEDDILGEFSLDEMETLQEEFGIGDYGRDEADDLLSDLDPEGRPKLSLGESPEEAEARRRTQGQVNQRIRRDMGYASSREELKSEDGPLAKMFPDSTERERGYLAYQLLANGTGGEDDRVPQELWDTFVRLVEEEHPEVMERLDAVPKTLETVDGYERLTQSGLISAPGIVNGIDPGQIGEPVTLYHAGYVDLRQADGTFAGKARQQFGPGVYTASEAFPVIYGWARPTQGTDGIQTGQPGYLHTTKWTGDGSPRILDMEEPLPDDLLDLALDHLFDLNRFIKAADPVKERPSTPEEYESFGQDMDWTFDEYRIYLKDELVARINNTIERIRRSQEQGRPQRTGREILGPNGGLADIFREIDITPDGIIDLTGNPDGWVKPAVVDRMRTKLNNDLVEAGYDVLRAIDVRREEFMFLDPSKVEFVDSAKISSADPFGTDGGHHLRQILYEESGYASTRGGGYAIHHADMRFGEERQISILPENRTYNQTLTNPDLYQYGVGTVKKVGSRRDQYEVTLNDGTKFRRSKLREVYEELERLKPQPNDRKPEESGFSSARGPNSAGRGRPQYDADGGTIPRIFDPDADYTYEDLEEWDMLELREAARSLGVPFSKKPKKELIEDVLARRTDRKRPPIGIPGRRNEEPSRLQQMDMLRSQHHNAERLGDQNEMDRLEKELQALGSGATRRRNRSSGHASSRQPPSPEDVVFRTEKFFGEHNLATPEPSGSQWVQTPDGGYARFSTRPEGEGTGDLFVEPLSGWHSPRQYVFATEEVAHAAQASGVPPKDEDVSSVPKVGLHALSLGPTPEQTHVSDRIIEVPKRRPVIPMQGFASGRYQSTEGVGPVRTGANGELVRDIELPDKRTVEVDASLAPRVKRMNDAGYLTAAAGSGNPEDYPTREAGTGYIGFYKSQLNDEKIDDLRRAAAEAGLSFEEEDLYFRPGVTVRTAMMTDGTPYFGSDGIHERSNALAAEELEVEWPDTSAIVRGLRPPMTSEENTNFYRLLDKREEIVRRLQAQHGGPISAEESQRRWAKFEDALLRLERASDA